LYRVKTYAVGGVRGKLLADDPLDATQVNGWVLSELQDQLVSLLAFDMTFLSGITEDYFAFG
jgi:hypothetical protein